MEESTRRAKHEYNLMVKLNKFDPSNFVQPFALLYSRERQIGAYCREKLETTSASVAIAMEAGMSSMEKYMANRPPLTPNECLDIAEKCLQIVRSAAQLAAASC